MLTALLVIGILVFLIMVHELGHFVAAKIFGVRVDEFGFGFPPRAYLLGKIGTTEYTLNWIPFGGFVRLFGEDDADHGSGSFADAARWKQAVILIAGVTMNLIAAWLLFTGAYMIGILHPVTESVEGARLIVSEVVYGSPADAAGFVRGDEVIGVRDTGGGSAPLTPDGVMVFVSARAGEVVTMEYLRAGATSTAALTPAHAVIAGEAGRPAVGIGLVLVTSESLPFAHALVEAYYQTKGTFALVLSGLGTILGDALRGQPDLSDVVGPVGLVGAVGEASDSGWGYVLSLAAFISVNLVIVNLIPIPALDGGRLVVVGIESIIRRPAPTLVVQVFNTAGIALIILLMVTVTYQDIVRLIA
jgi:regulator of sigma E protease